MQLSIVASLLAASLAYRAIAAEVSCWAPDGETIADNSTYVPCNKLGIEQEGVFSSCCRLDGDPQKRDLCTTRGLCLHGGVNSRGYCTDKTWKSPACVNVCGTEKDGGRADGTIPLTQCDDHTYCCGLNNLTCCGTDRAVVIPTQASVVASNVTETATVTETAAPDKTYKNATIGLGAAIGALALIALGVILWLWKQNKALRRQLAERIQTETTPASQLAQPYSAIATSTSPGMSDYEHSKPPYGATPASPGLSEIHGQSRYSELDAYNGIPAASPSPHHPTFDHSPRGSPLPSPRL